MDASGNWHTHKRKETLKSRLRVGSIPGERPVTRLQSRVAREQGTFERSSLNDLLTNQLLAALPVDEFEPLLPHFEPVALAADEDLYRFNEDVRFAYFPETAVISYLHVLAEGETAETAMVGREGVTGTCGLFKLSEPNYWSRVLIAGTALRINMEILQREFHRGLALQRLVLTHVSARMAQISQRAICNLHHSIEERLCSWLLMVHDRADEDRLQLTHERISSHLGVRRAGITCAANVLKDRGIIGYSRGLLWIRDRRELEAAACECYEMISRCVVK